MIFGTRVRKRTAQGTLSLFAIAGLASTANAQTYLIDISNIGDAVVIEQADPEYPGGIVPRAQEGWVRMHIVIGPDGEAIDPIIVDSSGGQPFEDEAIKAARAWRFEASKSGVEIPNNLVNIRTRIRRGSDGPSSDFIRQYRNIMRQIVGEQVEAARSLVEATTERGGWNLYESTLLWLLIGRVEAAEGDRIDQLEAYRRALSISTARSLGEKDRLGLLGRIFTLQDGAGHYADAARTFARLKKMDEDSELAAELAPRAAEIEALLQSGETLTASATIYNPCDCGAGQPLWYYRPTRRTFSFANLEW